MNHDPGATASDFFNSLLDEKYRGRELHVAFIIGDTYFAYPHDHILSVVEERGQIDKTVSWGAAWQLYLAEPSGLGS
jgi:hypothetical protein